MIKKLFFLYFVFLSFIIQAVNVYASDTAGARIGNKFFDTLEEAIEAAGSNDVISLINNISLDETLEINKTVNINLNNHYIKAEELVFLIQGGSLNLSGTGKISETKPNYGAIMLKGSNDPTKKDYSTVSIGRGITLEGWSGIFINHYNNTGYGILVNMNGSINAVNDVSGSPGAGIYINGSIKHIGNSPIINLSDTVKITSTGNGIYAAGYATYNINGSYISGVQSGLGIKSGVFNILNGTIVGTGEDKTPTSGNNNGINASGTAIQIESNSGYAGNIELYIKNGTIESKNSYVIYEYTVSNAQTQVSNIGLTGGTYTSKAAKDVFALSDSFKNTHKGFISGGTYSSNPTSYLKSGYSVSKNSNSLYEVVGNTMNVFNDNEESTTRPFSIILIVILIGISGTIIYLNRDKMLDLIKQIKIHKK